MQKFLTVHHLTPHLLIFIGVISIVLAILMNVLLHIARIHEEVKTLIDDTLKRDDNGVRRYSKTYLTMFTAWVVVLWSYHYDIIKNGFDINAFTLMVGVALGAKVTDAYSKKLNPPPNTNLPPR